MEFPRPVVLGVGSSLGIHGYCGNHEVDPGYCCPNVGEEVAELKREPSLGSLNSY